MSRYFRELSVAAALLLMLLALAYVAYQVGDTELALWALAGVGLVALCGVMGTASACRAPT